MHDSRSFESHAQAVTLGVVAGMRSQLPFALLALAASRDRFAVGSEFPLSLLRAPAAPRVLAVSAVGELVGDKLPFTPSRLNPGPLLGRILIGGLAGMAVAVEARRSLVLGAGLGVAGAVVGAEAGYHVRVFLGHVTGLPDPVWGAIEDAVAVALGLAVLRTLPMAEAT